MITGTAIQQSLSCYTRYCSLQCAILGAEHPLRGLHILLVQDCCDIRVSHMVTLSNYTLSMCKSKA